jgi:hypothetical protein
VAELEILALRWLDGQADAEQRGELTRALADPEMRERFVLLAQVHELLPRAMGEARRRRRRAGRLVMAVIGAAVAAVLVVVTWGMTAPGVPRLEAAPGLAWVERAGVRLPAPAALRAGDVVAVAANGAATLHWPDEPTTVALAGGARARWDGHVDGTSLELSSGRITVAAAPQPPGRALRVRTPHLAVAVLGTRFRIDAGAAASRVEVEDGRVSVAAAGTTLVLAAGEGCLAPEGSAPTRATIPRRRALLHDSAVWNALGDLASEAGLAIIPGPLGGTAAELTVRPRPQPPAVDWAWVALVLGSETPADWSGLDDLVCWVRGRGDGGVLRIELESLPAGRPLGLGDRFAVELRDDSAGWRRLTLPLASFLPRPGVSRPLDLVRVSAVALVIDGRALGGYAIGGIEASAR